MIVIVRKPRATGNPRLRRVLARIAKPCTYLSAAVGRSASDCYIQRNVWRYKVSVTLLYSVLLLPACFEVELGFNFKENQGLSFYFDPMSHKDFLGGEDEGIQHAELCYHYSFKTPCAVTRCFRPRAQSDVFNCTSQQRSSLDLSRGDLRKPIHLPFLVLPTVTSGGNTAESASGFSTATRNRWPRLRICLSVFSLVSMRASPLVLCMAFHSFSQNST